MLLEEHMSVMAGELTALVRNLGRAIATDRYGLAPGCHVCSRNAMGSGSSKALASRLQAVRPVAQKRIDQRIEKRWRLRDVLPYVEGHVASIATYEDLVAEGKETLNRWTYNDLISVVIDSPYFVTVPTGFLHIELNLPKQQCVQVYRLAASALLWAILEGFEDQGLHVPEGSILKELSGLSESQRDEWIDKT
jgi:hypothetical protein